MIILAMVINNNTNNKTSNSNDINNYDDDYNNHKSNIAQTDNKIIMMTKTRNKYCMAWPSKHSNGLTFMQCMHDCAHFQLADEATCSLMFFFTLRCKVLFAVGSATLP